MKIAIILILLLCVFARAETTNVCEDCEYKKIQDALDKSNDGDTIIVHSGIYREYIDIKKNDINLTGKDEGSGIPIITNEIVGPYNPAHFSCAGLPQMLGVSVQMWGNNVTISNFNITYLENNNSKDKKLMCGVAVASDKCNIINNTITNYLEDGILLCGASNSIICNNNIRNNFDKGIHLVDSSGNRIIHNILENNKYNIYITKGSKSNLISCNSLSKPRLFNAYDSGNSGSNKWNTSITGNYYSQFDCDSFDHGICLTKYLIPPNGSNIDWHPLSEAYDFSYVFSWLASPLAFGDSLVHSVPMLPVSS